MSKRNKNRREQKPKKFSQFEAMKSVRKPLPPATRVINPKKAYDRRDQSWLEEIENGDNDNDDNDNN